LATPELMALVNRHQNPLKVQWFTSHRSLHIWKWWEKYETFKIWCTLCQNTAELLKRWWSRALWHTRLKRDKDTILFDDNDIEDQRK
jgi:hypothetical protein